MKNKISTLGGLAALLALTAGCARNPAGPERLNSDGMAGFVSSEIVDMNGTVTEETINGGSLAREAADTINIEVVIDPWHLDSASNSFVRKATAEYPTGTRVRTDTVWFYDAQGNPVTQGINILTVDSVRHVRHVTRSRNGNEVSFVLDMTGAIRRTSTDTTFVRNGSVSGTYNGVSLERVGRQVTDLTFQRVYRRWSRIPISGTIDVSRPLYTIKIEFGGQNTATATITRRRDGETRTVTINIETEEEVEN